ncbi:hypothetical protein [Roseobacter sp. HKCCD7870]|uniref:hypothetical protein n=1 Tax=Roseobacter sp. HKCCD7870 TaxID=3120343 RepID=UPI0030EB7B57
MFLFLIVIFVMGIVALSKGWVWGKGYTWSDFLQGKIIYRSEEPIRFWLTVIAYLVCPWLLGASMVFGEL